MQRVERGEEQAEEYRCDALGRRVIIIADYVSTSPEVRAYLRRGNRDRKIRTGRGHMLAC